MTAPSAKGNGSEVTLATSAETQGIPSDGSGGERSAPIDI